MVCWKRYYSTLGYTNATVALHYHIHEEDILNSKLLSICNIELVQRGGWLVNESGLYSLIMHSKIPTAKQFEH